MEASLELKNLDLTSTGFIDPSSGIAGVLDFTASFNSDGQKVTSKGKVEASKMQLVPGGSPAKQPVEIDYDTEYQLKSQTGELKQGDLHVGKALAHLTGTYNVSGETPTVQLKLDGEDMPAADLESQLPSLGIILPSGASLQSGSLQANLTASGPIDRLVATGPINLSNAKLTGFDLGSKLGALSSFAGVPKGSDTVIQTLSSAVRSAPEGIRLDNLNLIVPVIGSLSGSGTIAPNHALDFKMVARLTNSASPLGGIAKLASAGSGQNGIPFKIQGTTSNPSFIPDMSGIAGGLAKGLISTPNQVPGVQNLGGALGGLFGKSKSREGLRRLLLFVFLFLLVGLEGDDDFLAVIEARNGVVTGGTIAGLGMKLVVYVGIKAAEMVVSAVAGDVGPHRQRANVFQVHDSGGDGILVFVDYSSADGAQLRFLHGGLRFRRGRSAVHRLETE